MRVSAAIAAAIVMWAAAPPAIRAGEWHPSGVVPSAAALADVIAAARVNDAPELRRRERWTYLDGTVRIPVTVAVRDDDFRTTLVLSGQTFMAGRLAGVRWRSDGNGIAHTVMGDDQSDAADVAPQAAFRIDWDACTLAGETRGANPSWVLETHRRDEKPAFLFVDKASGEIVREILRDGTRVVTTTFDDFVTTGTQKRPRHWHVDDGVAGYAIDATRDDVEPAPITEADVARPQRAAAGSLAPETTFTLPAAFVDGSVRVFVRLNGGRARPYVLDTGTVSITLNTVVAPKETSILEHAVAERLDAGPLQLTNVSALTIPLSPDGILGLDFFAGRVVEVGYRSKRVAVLSDADTAAVFADPKTTIVPIDVERGLPVVEASIGPADSETFALDTGSPRLLVMSAFVEHNAAEIAAHWTAIGQTFIADFLEGPIHVRPYRAFEFRWAGGIYRNVNVGAQIALPDDLVIPFDGIIGTDILSGYDLYFDYDRNRVGLRR